MQFKSIWLYTLLTVVSTVVCCQSFATGNSCSIAEASASCGVSTGNTPNDTQSNCINQRLASCSGAAGASGATNECTRLETDLRKEQSDLTAACQDVGLGGNACYESYQTCTEGDYDDGDEDDDGGSSLAPNSSRSRGTVPREKFRACPSTALDVAKEAKEELKELRDDLKDLKEKLAQKKLDIVAVENEITDRNTKYEEDVADRTKNYKEAVKEKTKGNEAETEDLTNRITETSQQLTKLVAQQDTLLIEYIEQVAQIEGICEAEAERELSKRREDQVKALQTSGQRQRNISELLRLRVSGRTSADETFRKRAILRCQQNPARYQRPVTLLNNRFEEKKAALKTAIAQTEAALADLQRKLAAANPKQAAELQEMATEYNGDLTRLKTARDAAVGTCQGAPQTLGANQTQNGAGQCSGLMKKLNIENQAQQTLENDIREKEADIAFTQDLFSAARSATGGNTSGAKATQSITGAGDDVASILKLLMNTSACSETTTGEPPRTVINAKGREWNRLLTILSPASAVSENDSRLTGTTGGSTSGGTSGSTSGGGAGAAQPTGAN